MTGRISVDLYLSRFSLIKALVPAAFAILLVCGFNGAASGQAEGAIQAIVEKSSYAGAKAGASSEGQGQARSSNLPRAAKAAVPKTAAKTSSRPTPTWQRSSARTIRARVRRAWCRSIEISFITTSTSMRRRTPRRSGRDAAPSGGRRSSR